MNSNSPRLRITKDPDPLRLRKALYYSAGITKVNVRKHGVSFFAFVVKLDVVAGVDQACSEHT